MIYEIKENNSYGGISIVIKNKQNKYLYVLGTFINVDIGMSEKNISELLDNIHSVLNGNKSEYKYMGEICAVYVHKDKTLIVDTLSGVNYSDDYDYDFLNTVPPDICDFEEIETVELKETAEEWYKNVKKFWENNKH